MFLCQNDEIIMTHGCIATIEEFGQVAMHLIYRLSYFCVAAATLVVKHLLYSMGLMVMKVYNYYAINKANDLIILCWNLNVMML